MYFQKTNRLCKKIQASVTSQNSSVKNDYELNRRSIFAVVKKLPRSDLHCDTETGSPAPETPMSALQLPCAPTFQRLQLHLVHRRRMEGAEYGRGSCLVSSHRFIFFLEIDMRFQTGKIALGTPPFIMAILILPTGNFWYLVASATPFS